MLCEYNCGREAKYTLKNGKHCCESSSNKCPAIKAKNSEGVKKAHNEGIYDSWKSSKSNLDALNKGHLTHSINMKEKAKDLFKKDSPLRSEYIRSHMINTFGFEEKCYRCERTEWENEKIPLEVHHIDGDHYNNEISNLIFLCPNCHALTDNFRGRNINKGKKTVSDEELLEALKSESSIRKALIKVGLTGAGKNYDRAYKILENFKKIEGSI